jgi:hypothetical protein
VLLAANWLIAFVLYRNWLGRYGWRQPMPLSRRTACICLAVVAVLVAMGVFYRRSRDAFPPSGYNVAEAARAWRDAASVGGEENKP